MNTDDKLLNDNKNTSVSFGKYTYMGISFFILAAQFLTVMMLSAAIAPSYNFNESAISDLGGVQVYKPLKYLSIVFGILGVIFVIIMIIGDAGYTAIFSIIGHGGAERMIVYPPILWMLVFGGYLMGKDSSI